MNTDILTPYATRRDIIAYYNAHPELIDSDIATLLTEMEDSLGIVDTNRFENPNGMHDPDPNDYVDKEYKPFRLQDINNLNNNDSNLKE